jgi:hypothetical protein
MPHSRPTLAYINGQLRAFGYVNRKCNYGIEYYLRDMSDSFIGQDLDINEGCINSTFENQLLRLVPSGTPKHVIDLDLNYTLVEWDVVENALHKWLFKYVNDTVGHRIEDPTNAFEASDPKFQRSIANELANQIKMVTQAKQMQTVSNSSDYFDGYVILFESPSDFYELRLGTHF